MSAGYVIYSLDWNRFRDMVERPTPQQLKLLAKMLADEREGLEGEFDDDDPILEWPEDANSLIPIVTQRLALPDWYSDLSDVGKQLWEGAIFRACMDCEKLGLDFQVDSDGVYWDVIEIANQLLRAAPHPSGETALSAFGTRPFRYYPPTTRKGRSAEYDPMHSMHTPGEVHRMRIELRSIAEGMAAADDADAREEYTNELMPALERIADEGRMLFIQVDT
jgi:hypothetical protein